MQVFLGADHGGFELKNRVAEWLRSQGYEVVDLGAHQLDPRDDYPQFAFQVAEEVVQEELAGEEALGVLCCRTGGGMVIAANKVTGARAVSAETVRAAQHARQHNKANILSLPADWLPAGTEVEVLSAFLTTPFSEEERHQRRVEQIAAYEQR